ncbi:DUF4276 family protein [Marinomonas profundi]|uniref:DUF4276 family protein n=1 Tax=Marinomonas profundi TaxID=2726122 RepID=UPI001B3ADC8A|nr:DUF4276 family protein [Marinomonas profundi]UDV02633.1 DUF4276 family protein [Marinomonas profundi]
MKLFVEGGGNSNQLNTECRKGFTQFVTAAGVSKRPRIVACGSRNDAYDSFCTEIKSGNPAMLLVDSEAAIIAAHQKDKDSSKWTPWEHLKQRQGDEWDKPAGATDVQCHFMVECMENWFLADRVTLEKFFGQGFHLASLPAVDRAIESVPKTEAYSMLKKSTLKSKKSEYGKGNHSFKLLAEINPNLVIAASPWADRFITELKKAMKC